MCNVDCRQVSCTKETFQDLSLPIPGKEQLQYIRASSQQFATSASSCDSPLLTTAGQRNPCAETGWKLTWLSSMFSWMFRFSRLSMCTQQQSVLHPFIQDAAGEPVSEKNIRSLTPCLCGYYTSSLTFFLHFLWSVASSFMRVHCI